LFCLGQLGLQACQLGLLLVVACFQLLQLASVGREDGGVGLGFFQRFVIGCLLRCRRWVLLCVGESLLCLGQRGLQACQLGLLLVVACFQLLQLAWLAAARDGRDLGFFQRFVIGCLLRCDRCVLLCVGESLLS